MATKRKINLGNKNDLFIENRQVGYKDGVEIEKGVVLNEDYLEEHFKELGDAFSFFSAYPDLFLDIITPETENLKLFFYQRIFLRAAMRFKIVYVTACLTKGTPVLTEYGMVPIEEVNPNDRIWTKDGWQQPENRNSQNWYGKFYTIKAQNCLNDAITVTADHEFYAVPREKIYSRPGTFWKEGLDYFNIDNYNERKEFYRIALRKVQPQWISAEDLKVNDWLLSPIDTEEKDIPFIKAPIPKIKYQNLIKDKITLNNLFYEWLGIWLAEGSWKENGTISFTIGSTEDRLLSRIQFLTQEVFGLKSSVYKNLQQHKVVIQINSKHLSDFLEELFQCKADEINQWNKFIPIKLLHCAPSKQLQLVKGWLDGDGYYRNKNGQDYKGTTVSSMLCEGIKMVLYRNFINPSVQTEIREGKSKIYNIVFGGKTAEEIENAINEERPVVITNEMRLSDYFPINVDGKLFMRNRISEINFTEPQEQMVYCLQMPNESFNVNGVEGHNCRAWSKSFLTILALILQCIFIPGRKVFICAPNKTQAATIAKEKIYEIYKHWPLIRREVLGGDISETPGNFGKDYVTLKFRNGSQFDVVGALESSLGGRRHGGLIDEIKNHDENMINTVVLPLLNVSRRLPDNTVNEKEPNQQVISATSAWQKTSFAYDRLIDNFEQAIITPDKAFVFGCDYRVPAMHGLLDKDYIQQLKLSPSFNETSFATEYLSYWQGASDESWFNFDKIQKYRRLKNPETHAIFREGLKQFYLLSVDVGRIHDQTVITVFRVNINGNNQYSIAVVNIKVIGRDAKSKTFVQQAIDIKKEIALFNPKEVVIDTNGLGVGLGDEMIRPQYDEFGNYYPAYGFFNDEEFKKTQPKDAVCILYSLKANGPLKSKIHGNVYSKLSSGAIRFLIKEQEAKSALLATKIGQKMGVEDRVKRLMPHEMTTKLFEEMANLRLKRTGTSADIVLEQINSRYPDDKYMSFAYGLWRITEIEQEDLQHRKRRSGGSRKLTFFTGGTNGRRKN